MQTNHAPPAGPVGACAAADEAGVRRGSEHATVPTTAALMKSRRFMPPLHHQKSNCVLTWNWRGACTAVANCQLGPKLVLIAEMPLALNALYRSALSCSR